MLPRSTLSVLAATAMAGSLMLFAPATTAAAEPSPTLVKTLLTDVTGDGRNDKVELFALGSDKFRLTVTAAKSGIISSVTFPAVIGEWKQPADALYGAAAIDGAKGMELIAQRWTDSSAGGYALIGLSVYTWRDGKLVAEKAPKGGQTTQWGFGKRMNGTAQGYRFFDKGGRRYVEVSNVSYKPGGHPWRGTITRSVWRHGAWVKVSTRKVALTDEQFAPYSRYNGPYVLKSIINTDIDGDSRADELRYYVYNDSSTGYSRYRLKVTTATGKVVTRKWATVESEPLEGVAELDGAAGAEVILVDDSDLRSWRVLTWRGGKLVTEKAPAACGFAGGGTTWGACDDYASIQWLFSTQGDTRIVDFRSADNPTGGPGTLYVDRSAWQAGKWVKLSSSTEPITGDWWDTQPPGVFAGVTLLEP